MTVQDLKSNEQTMSCLYEYSNRYINVRMFIYKISYVALFGYEASAGFCWSTVFSIGTPQIKRNANQWKRLKKKTMRVLRVMPENKIGE